MDIQRITLWRIVGEYSGMTCMRAHCIPCSVSFPPCRGLNDGFQSWPGRTDSPYYVVCKNERTIDEGVCPVDATWNSQGFPYKGRCVHRYALSTDYNPRVMEQLTGIINILIDLVMLTTSVNVA